MDEKYMELADVATTSMIDDGISRSRAKQIKPEGFDGHCTCGGEIPEQRIAMGYYNCTFCQTAEERRHKFYGRSP